MTSFCMMEGRHCTKCGLQISIPCWKYPNNSLGRCLLESRFHLQLQWRVSCKQEGPQKTELHLLFPIPRRFSLSPLVPHWLSTLGSQSSQCFTKHANTGLNINFYCLSINLELTNYLISHLVIIWRVSACPSFHKDELGRKTGQCVGACLSHPSLLTESDGPALCRGPGFFDVC